ncbi:unnamed protein product [Timema podura]|uniref:Uncharacterized protein n=1 Tax=Timema podura TaxID=61482 RepID=A0ABN7PA83_TIMPD|nr:unnamed protein product [Timema podura]
MEVYVITCVISAPSARFGPHDYTFCVGDRFYSCFRFCVDDKFYSCLRFCVGDKFYSCFRFCVDDKFYSCFRFCVGDRFYSCFRFCVDDKFYSCFRFCVDDRIYSCFRFCVDDRFYSCFRFCVGDRFYLCENKILCEYDYEERLVFANMAYNPPSLAHIKRQTSHLPPGAVANAHLVNGSGIRTTNPGPASGDLNNNMSTAHLTGHQMVTQGHMKSPIMQMGASR